MHRALARLGRQDHHRPPTAGASLILTSRAWRLTGPIGSLALLLSGCGTAPGCPPPRDSAERAEFRTLLVRFVHFSQCPGPPTPTALEAQSASMWRSKTVLIERIRHSPLAEDLAQAVRENEEASRYVFEAECAIESEDQRDTPENVAAYRPRLEAQQRELRAMEAAFARVTAGCAEG